MANAKFVSLVKIPQANRLIQGVKNGVRPYNAVAGGNGSFVVVDPAQLILTLKCDNGICLKQDIYYKVKEYTTRRITDKFCKEMEALFKDYDFQVENGWIINLCDILKTLD